MHTYTAYIHAYIHYGEEEDTYTMVRRRIHTLDTYLHTHTARGPLTHKGYIHCIHTCIHTLW